MPSGVSHDSPPCGSEGVSGARQSILEKSGMRVMAGFAAVILPFSYFTPESLGKSYLEFPTHLFLFSASTAAADRKLCSPLGAASPFHRSRTPRRRLGFAAARYRVRL